MRRQPQTQIGNENPDERAGIHYDEERSIGMRGAWYGMYMYDGEQVDQASIKLGKRPGPVDTFLARSSLARAL